MNGTEKQIAYATSMIKYELKKLEEKKIYKNSDRLKNKTREGATAEDLQERDRIINEMDCELLEINRNIDSISKLLDRDVYAGKIIDSVKNWSMPKTKNGYRNFLNLIN